MFLLKPVALVVRAASLVAFLAIPALLGIAVLPYLEGSGSYPWVNRVLAFDATLVEQVRSVIPTGAGRLDLARPVLLLIAFFTGVALDWTGNRLSAASATSGLHRKFGKLKKQAKRSKKSKRQQKSIASIESKLKELKPGDKKSREELVKLMVQAKRELDAMSRDVAFLALDVVDSTKMKLGEDRAFIEHDFKAFKEMVDGVVAKSRPLKDAWTPDGAMICFDSLELAVGAAQGMLKGLVEFNAGTRIMQTPFRVRCGVNAGRVQWEQDVPMEAMSDNVIDIAGHMQKYAEPDTIFVAGDLIKKSKSKRGFEPAYTEVDGYEVYVWRGPSADAPAKRPEPSRRESDADGGVGSPRRRESDAAAGAEGLRRRASDVADSALRRRASDGGEPGRRPSDSGGEQQESRRRASDAEPGRGRRRSDVGDATVLAPSPRAADGIPSHLGKYEVKRELGRGAMGIVYEGWDPGIERRVALKTVRPDQLDSSNADQLVERFRREAKAAGRLSHPGIVSVYDFGQEGETSFIAMEYIEGEELQHRLDHAERMPVVEVAGIMTQLLDALQTAGEAGIVHRDIKPANILLLENGSVKVTDFGIARVDASGLTEAGSILGTPAYMSPEQLSGRAVDPRSDIFSAGVVLYQMLTGEKPFVGNRVTTIIHKVLEHTPPDPSKLDVAVPKTFDAVVRKAIAKAPDDRYQTAAEFADAIQGAAR